MITVTQLSIIVNQCRGRTTNTHGPKLANIATRALRSKKMTITMENQAAVRAHKGTGIASFVIGVTTVILVFALIGTSAVMTKAGTLTLEFTMILGLGIISAGFVDLIGIVLGLCGAADRSSKKVYPVLGLALNIGILALFAALVVIGLAMKAH